MADKNPLIASLIKISSILSENGFEYCLAGGLAVGILATPRATEDIDIIIALDTEKRQILLNLIKRGFTLVQEKTIDFSFAKLWCIILKNSDANELIILDLMLADSEELKSAISGAFMMSVEGIQIPVISKKSLIKLKSSSERLKDKLDIQDLQN